MGTFIKDGTIAMNTSPSVASYAAAVGKMEGEGPLSHCFDYIAEDVTLGESSWEKSESKLQQQAFSAALAKGGFSQKDIDFLFAGDLLNQCTGSAYGARDTEIPFVGLYGACSTMAESLALGSLLLDGGHAEQVICAASSHFCTAERQYRYPLEFGAQRPPTSQWTVTGAGAALLCREGKGPKITGCTIGTIADLGIKDANNMGAAMAPAAFNTIAQHLTDIKRDIDYYDAIITGDLGEHGSKMLHDLFELENIDISKKHIDCGCIIYDLKKQDVNCGGSGCGCIASVFSGYFFNELTAKNINKIK